MPLWVDGVDVSIGRVILRQHRNEPAAAQAARDVPLCTHQDSVAIQSPVHSDSAVVGGEIAANSHRLEALPLRAARRQSPNAIGFIALPDADAIVAGEVAWRL